MKKAITLDQINDFHGDLMKDRDKLQFLEKTLFLIAGNKLDFLDDTDGDRDSNILHGLTNIIGEVATDLDGVINKLETIKVP